MFRGLAPPARREYPPRPRRTPRQATFTKVSPLDDEAATDRPGRLVAPTDRFHVCGYLGKRTITPYDLL
jgi:hypothetical protein